MPHFNIPGAPVVIDTTRAAKESMIRTCNVCYIYCCHTKRKTDCSALRVQEVAVKGMYVHCSMQYLSEAVGDVVSGCFMSDCVLYVCMTI